MSLAVSGHSGIVYVDVLPSAFCLRLAMLLGARDDYHSTAPGKAIAAYRPQPALKRFLHEARLQKKTARTIIQPAALERELARTQR